LKKRMVVGGQESMARSGSGSSERSVSAVCDGKMKQSEGEFPVKGAVGPANFAKLRLLGRGAMGQVYLVVLKESEPVRLYAMKEVSKNQVKRMMTEREIFVTTKHPFIVTMYASFQTKSHQYHVMEYCGGGEFFRILQSQPHRRLRESAVRFYAAEVILALEYLHSLGFIYRDLKPENIMMRLNGHLALTDFDLSAMCTAVNPVVITRHQKLAERFLGVVHPPRKSASKLDLIRIVDSEPEVPVRKSSFVGTPEYLAPEVISGEQQSGSVDWWTVGILVFEMLVGVTPFRTGPKHSEHRFHLWHHDDPALRKNAHVGQSELLKNVLHESVHFPQDVRISKDAKDFVRQLLTKEPSKRLGHEHGASDLKAHRWFEGLNFALIRNETPPIKPVLGHDPTDLSQYNPQSLESDDEPEGHGVVGSTMQTGWASVDEIDEGGSSHPNTSPAKQQLLDVLDGLPSPSPR